MIDVLCSVYHLKFKRTIKRANLTNYLRYYTDVTSVLLVLLPRDARSAKRGIAIVSRPSVCPSLCNTEVPWAYISKLSVRIISLGSSHLGAQHRQSSPSLSKKPAISLKRGKMGPRLLLMTNRKLCTRFRLVPKSVTLHE